MKRYVEKPIEKNSNNVYQYYSMWRSETCMIADQVNTVFITKKKLHLRDFFFLKPLIMERMWR